MVQYAFRQGISLSRHLYGAEFDVHVGRVVVEGAAVEGYLCTQGLVVGTILALQSPDVRLVGVTVTSKVLLTQAECGAVMRQV
jgi:hypothetical protein